MTTMTALLLQQDRVRRVSVPHLAIPPVPRPRENDAMVRRYIVGSLGTEPEAPQYTCATCGEVVSRRRIKRCRACFTDWQRAHPSGFLEKKVGR